ncbi:MAG: type II toxin-antitoxin system VapC family toxin [Lysobacteraceae bacterium]
MIAFLDANALIYLIEGAAPFAKRVREQLQTIAAAEPGLRIAASRLSWLECRVGPMKSGDTQTLAVYDSFFAQPDLICVELSASVIDLATAIRVGHGVKTPDALQAACCLQLGSEHLFVTGDKAFGKITGLNTHLLH